MVIRRVEEALGLPKLTEVADSLDKFPDEKQLKTIKEVLTIAERISLNAPELDQVVLLIKEINSMPIDNLKELSKVLKSIERIIKTAPEDLVDFLASLTKE